MTELEGRRAQLETDLRNSEEGSEVRTLAQTRTPSVLERLDPNRKAEIMRFLLAAQLVQSLDGNEPVILLFRTDLNDADLSNAWLTNTYLSNTGLYNANVRGAELRKAELRSTDLGTADLTATKGVATEELEQEAYSIEGATMATGQRLARNKA